ncbi:acetoin utilization protein AcuC [Oceanobacillus sp. J11TS1]|uniref:acetoin utilization protein AcuC n=1 Tax=Oceanobacillus sp. J11TS1 TaxID=2807191 RepID=UPI001B08CE8D|nr:acetoin utilization protein AcuC [Oceanobacillus sp. J11TS1]GIO24446.1 acetoin utilization protein AcuC [Oceanobacillus sp. J11TS1]
MTKAAGFIYTPNFLDYHFSEDHPFNQQRVLLTKELLEAQSTLMAEDLVTPRIATDEEIAIFHDTAYIEAVKRASNGNSKKERAQEYGLGTEDTPIFPNMHQASCQLVGGTLTAVEKILNGEYKKMANIGGGLHHGFQRKASGFCIYNDCAIAIKYLRKKADLKVLYVDTDAHHGDGVQSAFYDDPNVCTLSIHETGRYLFPGTGNVSERGIKSGHGYSFNLPIDAFTEDDSFLELYETALRKIAAFFKPDIIMTQNGADSHCLDPLTHLCGTMRIFEKIPLLAAEIADTYCDGKWLAVGGGGYDMWRVVPRAWGQVWNVMKTGTYCKGALPEKWISKWQNESPVLLPKNWEDGADIQPNIPRRPEITEKNKLLLEDMLKYTAII